MLVPYSAREMFDAGRRRRALPAVPALVRRRAGARRVATADKTARIDIDYHGVRAHFTTDNATRPASRSSSRCATARSATCTANGGSARSPRRPARSSSSSPTSSRRTCSSASVGPGVQPHRVDVRRRVRAPRRSGLRHRRRTAAMRERHRRLGVARAQGFVDGRLARRSDRRRRRGRGTRDRARGRSSPASSASRSSASRAPGNAARRRRPGRDHAAARRRPQGGQARPRRRPSAAAGRHTPEAADVRR